MTALLIHKRKPPVGAESVEIDKLESGKFVAKSLSNNSAQWISKMWFLVQ